MVLGGLLLLLHGAITRAWKECSTLGVGREMEGGHEARATNAPAREGKTRNPIRRAVEPSAAESCSATWPLDGSTLVAI
jgi:hypothetical protein